MIVACIALGVVAVAAIAAWLLLAERSATRRLKPARIARTASNGSSRLK